METAQKLHFGSYVLHDRIGAGGMAEIFLATAPGIEGFEKELVIKRILPSLSTDEQFVKMFVEEARLCVHLRHPNIVQVFDLGEYDTQYFIAMEYVNGRDLLKTLAACAKKRIAFPTDIALYIVMEVLKALDYAHNLRGSDGMPLGIIHRDVSPSNVLLSFDGKVKLGDFGIAKATIRERTATGILKGKFGYMAPEQVMGRPIDHRADVFAVGILLYELLTGHRLFAGRSDLAVLERVRDAIIDPSPRHYRPDLSHELEGIVMRALSREATDRFQSTSELHDALYDYTFRKGVVVSPRMLSRFLNDLFLTEETEEQYSVPVARPKNGNGHPSLLGKALVSSPDRELAELRRSSPQPQPRSREETSNDRISASFSPMPQVRALTLEPASERGPAIDPDRFEIEEGFDEDPTGHPHEFSEDETKGAGVDLEMIPFPGFEDQRQSSFVATAAMIEEVAENLEELTQQTDIADLRSKRPLRDPAEGPSWDDNIQEGELSQLSTGGIDLDSVREPSPSPASEVRALRRDKVENFETNLDLSLRRPSQARPRPAAEASMTPHGGVPVRGETDTSEPPESSVNETIDGEGVTGEALADVVRRAMDPTAPVEASDGEAERTDLLLSGVHVPPDLSPMLRAMSEEIEEADASDLIELTGDATHAAPHDAGFDDLSTSLGEGEQSPTRIDEDSAELSAMQTHELGDDPSFTSPELDASPRTIEEQSALSGEGPELIEAPITRADAKGAPDEDSAVMPTAAGLIERPELPIEMSELLAAALLDESALFGPELAGEISMGDSATGVRDEDIEESSLHTSADEPRTSADELALHGEEPEEDSIPSSVASEWQELIRDATTPKRLNSDSGSTASTLAPVEQLAESLRPSKIPEADTDRGSSIARRSRPVLLPADEAPVAAQRVPSEPPERAPSLRAPSQRAASEQPVLTPEPLVARPSTAARRAPSRRPFSRLESEVPRRRVATRAALSVVNPDAPPPDEATRLGVLAPGAEDEVHARGEAAPGTLARLDTAPRAPGRAGSSQLTGLADSAESTSGGLLMRSESTTGLASRAESMIGLGAPSKRGGPDGGTSTAPRIPARRMRESSGITSALSEAALADEEIKEIRAASKVNGRYGALIPDELTCNGDLAGLLGGDGPSISLSDPTDPHGSLADPADTGDAPLSLSAQAKVRKRYTSRGVVLFDDAEETVNAPGVDPVRPVDRARPITDLGRLEDSGASDLFGALSLIDGVPPDLEMRGFEHEEEASMETTGVNARDFQAEYPGHGPGARAILAPSVEAELRARSETGGSLGEMSGLELRDPAEEPSGIELRFDGLDEPTDSLSEEALPQAIARYGGAASRPRSVVVMQDDGYIEDASEGGTMAPEILDERMASDSDRDPSDHFHEETPAADDFEPSAVRFQHEETPAVDDLPSSERGVYGSYAPDSRSPEGRLVSDSFDLDLGLPQRNARLVSPARTATPAPAPRTSSPGQSESSAEAERRLRAVVERQRPAKEVKRSPGSTTPPPALMPTATAFAQPVPRSTPDVVVRGGQTPVAPQVARGPIPSHKNPPAAMPQKRPVLTTKLAMAILVVVVAVACGTVFAIQMVERGRSKEALAIAPVDSARAAALQQLAPAQQKKPAEPVAETPPPKLEPSPDPAPEAAERKADPRTDPAAATLAATKPVEPVKAEPKPQKRIEPKREEKVAVRTPPRPQKKAEPVKRAAPRRRFASNAGGIRVECRQPVDVVISRSGSYDGVTKKFFPLQPGTYNVTLKRADGTSSKSFVRVVAGEPSVLSCDR